MRPKKRILLIDTDEDRQGRMRFLLQTHAFAVISAAPMSAMQLAGAGCDLILAMPPQDAGLLKQLHQIAPYTPVLSIGARDPHILMASDASERESISSAELIARIRQMCARKRGPKKIDPAAERAELQKRWSAA